MELVERVFTVITSKQNFMGSNHFNPSLLFLSVCSLYQYLFLSSFHSLSSFHLPIYLFMPTVFLCFLPFLFSLSLNLLDWFSHNPYENLSFLVIFRFSQVMKWSQILTPILNDTEPLIIVGLEHISNSAYICPKATWFMQYC